MIKRIIFDLDDTLIPVRYKHLVMLCEVYNKYIKNEITDLENIINGISKRYDKNCIYYNKIDYLNHINKELNTNLKEEFIDEVLETMGNFAEEEDKVIIPTLEYLSNKYELVILSNWFNKVQVNRLKKIDILKYFKEVYTCDTIPRKPNDESFLTAKGDFLPEECVMVGDNYLFDIKRAKELGFTTVYVNKNADLVETDYKIEDIKELNNLF